MARYQANDPDGSVPTQFRNRYFRAAQIGAFAQRARRGSPMVPNVELSSHLQCNTSRTVQDVSRRPLVGRFGDKLTCCRGLERIEGAGRCKGMQHFARRGCGRQHGGNPAHPAGRGTFRLAERRNNGGIRPENGIPKRNFFPAPNREGTWKWDGRRTMGRIETPMIRSGSPVAIASGAVSRAGRTV